MTERMSVAEYKKAVGSGDEIRETPLSKQIQQLLNALGLENDRIQAGKLIIPSEYERKDGTKTKHTRVITLAKKGTPDRWCLIHKRWCLLEIKVKGKKPTKEQIQRHRELAAAGAIIINGDSFESFESQIKQLMKDLDPKRQRQRIRELVLAQRGDAVLVDHLDRILKEIL